MARTPTTRSRARSRRPASGWPPPSTSSSTGPARRRSPAARSRPCKAVFVDAQGNPRTDNILKAAGAVVGFVALVVVLRKVAS